jgi:septal ring factor EnvC (AmiA/AmiB activator)
MLNVGAGDAGRYVAYLMKRYLIPKSKADRVGLGVAIVFAVVAGFSFSLSEIWLTLISLAASLV